MDSFICRFTLGDILVDGLLVLITGQIFSLDQCLDVEFHFLERNELREDIEGERLWHQDRIA